MTLAAFRSLPGVVQGLAAAALFGASTPLAKALLGTVPPLLLAGLLYAGSGLGLGAWLLIRRLIGRTTGEASLARPDVPWLAGAVLFGGVLGPALLMLGLAHTPASAASLLLNLESVLTAVLAWVVFRENVDRRVGLGMLAIVVGSGLLSWHSDGPGGLPWGALAVAGACLCWAIDNNLTRPVAGGDPVQIAAIKGAWREQSTLGLPCSPATASPIGFRCSQQAPSVSLATASAWCSSCWRYDTLAPPGLAPTFRPRRSLGRPSP